MNKKVKIMRNFSKAAKAYDDNSALQKSLENILLERISKRLGRASTIVDIGSGTGSFCEKILKLRPKISIFGFDIARGMVEYSVNKSGRVIFLQADAENIPFKEGFFDIAVSNSVYQWIEDLDKAFFEARRVLKASGEFHFAFFAGRTLEELKFCFDKAYKFFALEERPHSEKFLNIRDIKNSLKKADFSESSLSSLVIEKGFKDVDELLGFLRLIGAKNTNITSEFGLGRKKVFLKMKEIYKNFFIKEGFLKATFEIFIGSAKK